MTLRDALIRLVEGHDLTRAEARAAMRSLVDGEATPAQIGAFAIALRMKGETAEEIAGLAEVMREAATRVDAGDDVVDLVGTGGDGQGTFNISTLSAFIVASAGGRVAKHGNRGVTSGCGAADFLEAIGVVIDLPPEGVAECVRETGFGFMFAPLYHPALRHAVGPRREIGVRTVFNILGPLTNPAFARRQLTGVPSAGLTERVANVMALMGADHAMVVHSEDGLDEISCAAATHVFEVQHGSVRGYSLRPADFGMSPASLDSLRGGTIETNVALAQRVLDGSPGPQRDVVLLNAAAGLYVAGVVDSLAAAVHQAAQEIDSGRAAQKVSDVAVASQRIKARASAAAVAEAG